MAIRKRRTVNPWPLPAPTRCEVRVQLTRDTWLKMARLCRLGQVQESELLAQLVEQEHAVQFPGDGEGQP